MHTIDHIITRLRDSRPARYGAMAAIGITAGDTPVYAPYMLKNALVSMGSGAAGLKAIKESTRILVKTIDPRLEELSPELVLSLGNATFGNTRSSFIANPLVIAEEEWKKIHGLVEQRLLSNEELISFYNVLGAVHQEQARRASHYKEHPNATDRMRIARLNSDAGTVPAVLLMQIVAKKPAIQEAANHGTLTMTSIKEAYPNVSRVFPLIQMTDDLSDIVLDIMDEIRTGRPSTNLLLAKAHEQGGLIHDSGRLSPTIVLQSAKAFKEKACIPVEKLHPVLQRAIKEGNEEFHDIAATFNPTTRKLLELAWGTNLKQGIKPAANERLEATRTLLR